MGILAADCPHCHLSEAAFLIVGQKLWPTPTWQQSDRGGYNINITVGSMCPRCNGPVGAVVEINTFGQQAKVIAEKLVTDTRSVEAQGGRVLETWPKPPEPRVPNHLPPIVESAFLQAERAFSRGDTDAAGMMYRRAFETAVKLAFPAVSGSLFQRITALVTNHDLPPAIGEWAHEVRIIGNDAAHDTESLSVEDMTATRNFVDAVLRYAISLPKEIALRRAETTPVEAEVPALPAP